MSAGTRFAGFGSRFAPLRVPAFGRLLAGYTVNQLGDQVGLVALALAVYAQTRDPLATTALFLCAQFLPAFFAPALTARVDHVALRRALPRIYLAEAAIFAVLAWVAGSAFNLPAILALSVLDGALMLTARGLLRAGLNSALTPAGLLREGNALVNLGFAAASVGGAAVGGALVDLVGVSAALLVDAASFVLIAGLLAAARGLPERTEAREGSAVGRLLEGLRWVWRERLARLLFAGEAVALVLFTLIVPIEVVYAAETLETSDAGYGLLLAAWGAGVVLGSTVFLRLLHQPPHRLILGSTLAIGVAYAGMGATRALGVACALSVLGGAGNGIQWVAVLTRLQEETPDALQARVLGLFESVASVMTGVGFLLGGVLTAVTAPETAFTVAGAGLVGLVALGAVGLRPRRPRAAPSGGASDARR